MTSGPAGARSPTVRAPEAATGPDEDPLDTHPFARRTLVILNPAAGQDDPARLRRRIGGAFAARRAAFDIVETVRPGHAGALARRGCELGYRAVCIAGGDGTIAEASNGLAGGRTPLGVIPRGTGNQVAQNLLIPQDLDAAVEVIVHGRAVPLDLGRIGDRSFALAAGAGFDAAVMAAATRTLKERWGFAAYVYAAMKEALAASPAQFRITADGRVVDVRAVSVMLANVGELFASFLPFGFYLAPQPTRSWQDGYLDVVIVAPKGVAGLAAALWKSARRHFIGEDHLIHFQAREITIEADPPMAVQIDGDAAGVTPVTASVMPGGVHILTPA